MTRALSTLCLVLLFTLTACKDENVQVKQSSNPDKRVTTLFMHEGCTLYRFFDLGDTRYYAKCGASAEAMWDESCGKYCKKNQSISSGVPE